MEDGSKPLANTKHEKFVQAMLAKDNQREAYKRVYGKCTAAAADTGASRLLKNAKVAARLAFLKSEVAEEVVEQSIVDKLWVQERLMRTAQSCLGERKVLRTITVKPKKGTGGEPVTIETEDLIFDAQGAAAALRLLGLDLGMFKEVKDVNLNDQRPAVSNEPMSPEEWQKRYALRHG